MDREPGKNANVLQVRGSLEAQQRQLLVDIVGVLSSLARRVGEIGPQASIYVGIRDVGAALKSRYPILVSSAGRLLRGEKLHHICLTSVRDS